MFMRTLLFFCWFVFSFFRVFGFWVWVFCKSLANSELGNLKYGFEYKYKKLEKIFFILNCLIRNLQKICEILKPKTKLITLLFVYNEGVILKGYFTMFDVILGTYFS